MTTPTKLKLRGFRCLHNDTQPEPGLLTEIPIRNVWHMLLYAWNAPEFYEVTRLDAEMAPALDALLASILCMLIERQLQRGLRRAYRESKSTIRGIRGRISFTESTRQQLFERGYARCTFFELTADVPRNQIIKAVLRRLILAGNFGSDIDKAQTLRHRLRTAVRLMANIRDVEPRAAVVRMETFNHGDGNYRLMLNIVELLLRHMMPSETAGTGSRLTVERESLTLFKVFEAFVAKFYQHHLTDWLVHSQSPQIWHLKKYAARIPQMVPDLRLTHRTNGSMIVLDTKYYRDLLSSNQGSADKFHASHLYQMYAYLRTQEHLSPSYKGATGILLYPAVHFDVSETLELPTTAIRVETIDLARTWSDIERYLLGIVKGSTGVDELSRHNAPVARARS